MIQLRNLHRQYESHREEIDSAIASVLSSAQYIMGQPVSDLEEELCRYVGVKHCITCANGTDALVLTLIAAGIGYGDIVYVPDFTFFATAEAVLRVGATPIFVDVEESTFNIDPSDLERKHAMPHEGLAPRALIAVDLFGQPANYPALRYFADLHGLILIEDGAQGFGGSIGDRRACSFADIATTSFFPAKPLGCYGDGGAVFTDSDDYAATLRSLRLHGKGNDKYHHVRVGFNSRLDTLQAAILLVKLRNLDDELQAVDSIAKAYTKRLHEYVATPTVAQGFSSAWAQYTLRHPNRDAIQARLRQASIPSAIYYPTPLHTQPVMQPYTTLQGHCPVSSRLASEVLSLPCHPYLTFDEVDLIANAIIASL